MNADTDPTTLCLAAALALAAGNGPAHGTRDSTTPADGAVPDTAPDSIGMTFDSPMRPPLGRLTDASGAEVDPNRTGGMAATTSFRATPDGLDAGDDTVAWRGPSDDGHPTQGAFSFRVAG